MGCALVAPNLITSSASVSTMNSHTIHKPNTYSAVAFGHLWLVVIVRANPHVALDTGRARLILVPRTPTEKMLFGLGGWHVLVLLAPRAGGGAMHAYGREVWM